MPKFIMSALPALLLGTLLGFGLARLGQGEDEDDVAARERSLAKACVGEARKVMAMQRPERERNPLRPERPSSKGDADATDPAKRAERTIDTALKRARAEKRWTVSHGKMAERMFPRLSDDDARELSQKLLGAIEKGDIVADESAWLPEKK